MHKLGSFWSLGCIKFVHFPQLAALNPRPDPYNVSACCRLGALSAGSLTSNLLCGVDLIGNGTYTAEGIAKIAEALQSNSTLTALRCVQPLAFTLSAAPDTFVLLPQSRQQWDLQWWQDGGFAGAVRHAQDQHVLAEHQVSALS